MFLTCFQDGAGLGCVTQIIFSSSCFSNSSSGLSGTFFIYPEMLQERSSWNPLARVGAGRKCLLAPQSPAFGSRTCSILRVSTVLRAPLRRRGPPRSPLATQSADRSLVYDGCAGALGASGIHPLSPAQEPAGSSLPEPSAL